MRILEIESIDGPNAWSLTHHKIIQMKLDLEELEERPTDKIDGFLERIKKLMPSLYEHRCSEGIPGGFFLRIEEGTWMGHVIEHIALEIQTLAGSDAGFGRVKESSVPGVYFVIFKCNNKYVGEKAAKLAVDIAQALVDGKSWDIAKSIGELKEILQTTTDYSIKSNIEDQVLRFKNIDYHVALSFAGEDRPYVKKVAEELKSRRIFVFFDEYEETQLWGKDLYQHLSNVYSKKSYYCVIFISKHYAEKLWTKHELRNAQERAFKENHEYILPVRFDSTEIPGISSTIGYVDCKKMEPIYLASLIYEKLKHSLNLV